MTGDSERQGAVFWITGLSGSGKTTVGQSLFRRLRFRHPGSVFLDGDQLRRAVAEDLGYSTADRLKCARRYGLLARLLAAQGVHVVLSTISMFAEVRDWNRRHIPGYCEIYLRTPLAVLRGRDRKGLYSNPGATEIVGVDLPFEAPENPDVLIENDEARTPEDIAEEIWRTVRGRL